MILNIELMSFTGIAGDIKGKVMKQISFEEIADVISGLSGKTGNQLDFILEKMMAEQPAIVDFLYQPGDLEEREQSILIYTAQIGWFIIKKVLKKNALVSEEFLYEQLSRNEILYRDSVYNSSKDDDEISVVFHQGNSQPYLMDYLVKLISEHLPGTDDPVRGELVPNLVIDVKTVVDCLVLDEKKVMAETCDAAYSEESFSKVKESLAVYFSEFKKSRFYIKLGQKEKNEAELVVSIFGEMMYNYFLQMPLNWTARRSLECCIGLMPRKVVANENFFYSVEPVLRAFMLFCAENGYVADAENIERRLCEVTEDLLLESDNPESWGIGKPIFKNGKTGEKKKTVKGKSGGKGDIGKKTAGKAKPAVKDDETGKIVKPVKDTRSAGGVKPVKKITKVKKEV